MSRSRNPYDPLAQRQWSRIDADWAPQGHALHTATEHSEYFTWQERTQGPFLLLRVDPQGNEFGPFEVPDLPTVQLVVLQSERALAGRPLSEEKLRALATAQQRRANPGDRSFNADLKAEFIARGGIGAFIGAIAGALIGGTPGILLGNTPVTSVGAHVGSIMGAAAGAYIGGYAIPERESNPAPEPIAKIKKRVLK